MTNLTLFVVETKRNTRIKNEKFPIKIFVSILQQAIRCLKAH